VTVYSPAGGNYAQSNTVTAQLTTAKTTPAGSWAGKTVLAPYTIVAGDLHAAFANPVNSSVVQPTGTVTYSVSVGYVLQIGIRQIQASYPGDANYNPATATATFTVLDPNANAANGDGLTNQQNLQLGLDPLTSVTSKTPTQLQLTIQQPNQ
jgi:hypothetical protein